MSDADILAVFGINENFTLMEYNRSYDPAIKGFIEMSASFAFNQAIREVTGKQAAQIGVGKSDIAFSKSQKRGFYMGPKELTAHWSEKTGIPIERLEKLIRINTEKNYKSSYDGIFNEETGETILEAKTRITRDFLKQYPQWGDYLMRSGFGGQRRSTYGTIKMFESLFPPTGKEIL